MRKKWHRLKGLDTLFQSIKFVSGWLSEVFRNQKIRSNAGAAQAILIAKSKAFSIATSPPKHLFSRSNKDCSPIWLPTVLVRIILSYRCTKLKVKIFQII